MESNAKNKQIHIDKEALCILELAQENLLQPVTGLMSQKEMLEVDQSGFYKNCSFPSSLILSPSGKKNEEIITSLQPQENVELCIQDQSVGTLQVEEIFPIDKESRIKQIMGGNLGHPDIGRVYKRIGNYAVYGKYQVITSDITRNKAIIRDKIQELGARKISGIFLNANPIHKVHEKILQEALLRNDLLIIFLTRPHHTTWLLPYELRYKNVQCVIDNFLPSARVLLLPMDYTYLLSGTNRMILNAIICKNYGCTEFIASLGSSNLSTFYEGDRTHTILDSIQGVEIAKHLVSEYIYCDTCNNIKSTKICPHGTHHHISYDSRDFFELLKLGVMPPEVFIRKEVSASILAHLFPSQAKKLDKLYYDLISSKGIIEEGSDENFYINLSRLYRVK
ncbi:hypothetical protein BBW65_07345 [Helicobacter enhydrae]|uniref:Sulfate adenylyltransferase n=1 Tax=Helicobacter enhydrae TaxID=222136 RepID=A0A1B1U7F8_9HELI|nr:hypothetical protein [Helicobacter enhydrae]ANV98622.1 hypothetical protein BBW65_07345 [Helicobacter enhydrae]